MTEKHKKIIELYEQGVSNNDIVKECKCSIGTIYNVLKRNNLKHRDYHKGILKNIEDEVIERYNNSESVHKICKEMKLYPSKVNFILSKNKIEEISSSKRYNINLNEDYFENIDSNEKAYWLGFLITDGCVSKGNAISLTLHKKDRHILEVLEKDLGVENKIKDFNKEYVRFMFCCKKMVNDLEKYGIVKNKTTTVTLPNIDDKYLPSLLRGCIDGDGGISKHYRNGKYEYELSFCGNKNCVMAFNEKIKLLTSLKERNITKNNSIWRVRWFSKKEILLILKTLYHECGEHKLIRKYNFINELEQINYEIS